ncbi:hypothetical protein AYL99_12131 [Fonsecaea erecta]|uniref:Uncharacterized protein n=1 Tax=Fonsecaea erecta TaxID=1367422 RepID=A0A178Z1L6_9EURO|nr:hypothetical protein AYL99_12131 [Fonsecaea erecta]OAP53698.1 hypothetical protein AYL99_12131 [Fonsecaea erecta]
MKTLILTHASQTSHPLRSSTMSSRVAGGGPIAVSGGGKEPRDNRQPSRRFPQDAPGPSPSRRAKTVAKKAEACCRCLRRLCNTGAGKALECKFVTPKGLRSKNCAYCSGAKRGGDLGCVPVPPSLVSRANRLWNANLARVRGEVNAPTVSAIQAAALALSNDMRLAGADVARKTSGGITRTRARSGRFSVASDQILVSILDAIRAGVDSFREVNKLGPRRWPDEDSGSEQEEEEEEEEDDEENDAEDEDEGE